MTKQELKDIISDIIKSNGSGSITGDVLQEKLIQIIDFDLPTQLLNSSVVESFNDFTGDELIIFIKDDDVIKLSLDNFIDLIKENTSVNGASESFSFKLPTDNLTSSDLGLLVTNINGKAELLSISDDIPAQKGRWNLEVKDIPILQSRIIDIDFTNVLNIDFNLINLTSIALNSMSGLNFNLRVGNEFNLGATINKTLDNIVVSMQSNGGSQIGVTKIGKIIRIDLCVKTYYQFKFDQNSITISFNNFVVNTPTYSNYQEQIGSNGDFEDFVIYGDIYPFLTDEPGVNLITLLYGGSDWGMTIPNNINEFVTKLIQSLGNVFNIISSDSSNIVFEEYNDPYKFGKIYIGTDYGNSLFTLTELEQSKPIIRGQINGLLLGEVLKVSNNVVSINTDLIIGLKSDNEINVGDLVVVYKNGKVRKIIGKNNIELSMNDNFIFIALTSGKNIKGRLVNPYTFIEVSNSGGSSSSGY